jgi:antitoxin HigA-1
VLRLSLHQPPLHPGRMMRQVLLEDVRLPITEAARQMRVPRPTLYRVFNGKAAVTAELALRFVRLTGGTPDRYLRMQIAFDLWRARERLRDEAQQPHRGPHNVSLSALPPKRP